MKKVLVAPLDWGLGHASRCVPIIRELQRQECEVVIAGNGDALALLRAEFPATPSYPLPGYDPRYPGKGSMALSMAVQLPHFARVIPAEHEAVGKIIREQSIDLIISDNRYGCWSNRIPSVFVTHQSNVIMPKGLGFLRGIARKMNEGFINRFQLLWIPDVPGDDSLAGDLASVRSKELIAKTRYVGWLSRFNHTSHSETIRYDVIAILSGPEPQRTLFEDILLPQLRESGLRYLVVRGLPSSPDVIPDQSVINFMGLSQLQQVIRSAATVVSRSGYSTVMDMQAMGRKVIFVPTPGQTEQEYLAGRLMEKGVAFTMPQSRFRLSAALVESKKYSGFKPSEENDLLARAIHNLMSG
ncbi:MAG: glycosyl transferase family 28 [Bacteroidota bacterium]|nr:glycosyl transferase family 28 [Bacteroidota bacterium]